MKKAWITGCAVAMLLVTTPVVAKMYKCVGEDGSVSYSQTGCSKTEKIDQVREQEPAPGPRVVPVIGLDGKQYYVESDRINIKNPRSSDYYSPGNQVKRLKQEREATLDKQLTKERRAQRQRNYQKAVELQEKETEEYREGRCRYYKSMSRGNHKSTYYKARRKEFCD